MKAKIVDYDYNANRATFEFEPDFSTAFDKYADKDINIEIKLWKPKRSGAANRYLWVLIDKIARATHQDKSDIYREAIRDIGGVSDVFLMHDEAVAKFQEQWAGNGLGWQTEVIPLGDGRSNVIAYYGSSTFDRDQMTELIEKIVFEAEQLEIDVDTPDRALWWESLQEDEYKNASKHEVQAP